MAVFNVQLNTTMSVFMDCCFFLFNENHLMTLFVGVTVCTGSNICKYCLLVNHNGISIFSYVEWLKGYIYFHS